MDTKFQTSFIPKKAISPVSGKQHSEPVSIFLIISIIVFIISLSSAGGVFAYKKMLIGKIETMNADLAKAKNSFEPESIEKIRRLGVRINAAGQILTAHGAVSPIFEFLENKTLATVKFNNFSFSLLDDGTGSISMTGVAKNFSSIALQSDIFGKEKSLKNPVFSDLNQDLSGNATFKFTALVDSTLTSYKQTNTSVSFLRD